jgi:hypothetical protein
VAHDDATRRNGRDASLRGDKRASEQARAKRPRDARRESRPVYFKLLGLESECASDSDNFINGAGEICCLRSCTAMASLREREEGDGEEGEGGLR